MEYIVDFFISGKYKYSRRYSFKAEALADATEHVKTTNNGARVFDGIWTGRAIWEGGDL